MKIIADISDTIECLLDSAEEYIEYAHEIKEDHAAVASLYCKASMDMMALVGAFHE